MCVHRMTLLQLRRRGSSKIVLSSRIIYIIFPPAKKHNRKMLMLFIFKKVMIISLHAAQCSRRTLILHMDMHTNRKLPRCLWKKTRKSFGCPDGFPRNFVNFAFSIKKINLMELEQKSLKSENVEFCSDFQSFPEIFKVVALILRKICREAKTHLKCSVRERTTDETN